MKGLSVNKTGVLLINLGTPKSLKTSDIRSYLKEFLLDPKVIDIHPVFKYMLVYGLILPFRPKKIKPLYENIWTKEGSPLLLNSQSIAQKLADELGSSFKVVLGMRYGSPSLKDALSRLSDCDKITVLPLYPQYATSSTGTALDELYRLQLQEWDPKSFDVINYFYDRKEFIDPLAQLIKNQLEDFPYDHLLFSYHGIPERHIRKSSCEAIESQCKTQPCPEQNAVASTCYRYQCYQTTRLLRDSLGLKEGIFSTSFQSRLGRTPWIKPYTDFVLPDLIKKGVKNLAIASPSFITDCLETDEEIGIRLKESWLELGGQGFKKIDCLNDNDFWIKQLSTLVQK